MKWFKKKKKTIEVKACTFGELMDLAKVDDPAFSSGALGRGVAIKPNGGKVVSPLSGTIKVIFPTNHALGIETEEGLEFLIHIGVDTVKLKGEGFKRLAEVGDEVKAGDPLIEVDWALVESRGYPTEVIMVLTTDESQADFELVGEYGSVYEDSKSPVFTCQKID